MLVKVFVSVLRPETENRTLLLTAAGAFRKPDENGPLSSSESGFLNFFDILSRTLLFHSKAALANWLRTFLKVDTTKTTCCKTNRPVSTAKQIKDSNESSVYFGLRQKVDIFPVLKPDCPDRQHQLLCNDHNRFL